MRRGTALLAVVALFLSGVLVGVLGTHVFYLYKVRQPGGLGEIGARFVAWDLERKLDLTAEQRQQIDQILAETRREGLAIRHETIRDVVTLVETSHNRLAAVLTPEQRVIFETQRKRYRSAVERFFSSI